MTTICLTDTSPRADIEAAITELRARHAATDDAGLREELAADIDDALGLWAKAVS